MPNGLKDSRFEHVAWDPRYRRVPKQERRLAVDKRFAAMFTDKEFVMDNKVDKRGRKVSKQPDSHLREYYDLDERTDQVESDAGSGKKEIEQSPSGSDVRKSETTSGPSANLESCQTELIPSDHSVASSDSDSETNADSLPIKLDLARGEGNISSSDEACSSSEDELDTEEDLGPEHAWGQLDQDAKQVDESTHRLACVNQDWDAVRAMDIFIWADSFKPTGSKVQRVAVYKSDFGKSRMEDESVNGPLELRQPLPKDGSEDQSSSDDEPLDVDDRKNRKTAKSKLINERIRAYQLARLRYFYAVITCDNRSTAEHIYEQCDKMQLEASTNQIDLRFIPDDMNFDEADLRDEATAESVDIDAYDPVVFANAALGQKNGTLTNTQVRATLTWEEGDKRRANIMRDAFTAAQQADTLDAISKNKLRQVLASGSSSEDEESNVSDVQRRNKVNVEGARKLLLLEADKNDKLNPFAKPMKSDGGAALLEREADMEMSISWQPAKPAADSISDDSGQSGDGSEQMDSLKKRKKKTKRNSKLNKKENTDASDPEKSAALAMLVSENDEKDHYDLEKLLKEQKRKDKALKRKGPKKVHNVPGDNFELDLNDDRFSALFTDYRYNVDPSSAHFKKTEAMQKLVQAKATKKIKIDRDGSVADPSARSSHETHVGASQNVPRSETAEIDPCLDLEGLKKKSEKLLESKRLRLEKFSVRRKS